MNVLSLLKNLRTARGTRTKAFALALCTALSAATPMALGQSSQEAAENEGGQPGSLRFPIAGSDGFVELRAEGGDNVRVGQDFDYTLRVTNSSSAALHDVVVRQTLPANIQLTHSSPEPEQGDQSHGGQRRDTASPMDQRELSRAQTSQGEASQPQTSPPRDTQPSDSQAELTPTNRERDVSQPESTQAQQPETQQPETQQQGATQQPSSQPASSQPETAQPATQQPNPSEQRKTQAEPSPQSADADRLLQEEAAQRQQSQVQRQQSQAQGTSARRAETSAGGQRGTERQDRQSQSSQAQDGEPQVLAWRLGALKPGETRMIRMTAAAGNPGAFDTCAWVSFQPTLCRQINVTEPELRLSQQIMDASGNSRDRFYACETVFVRYRLSNTGTGNTTAATISGELPQGVAMNGKRELLLPVGVIGAGETVERTARLDPTQIGEVTLRARASTDTLEANSNHDRIEIVKPELDLRVQAPRESYLGRSVTYQLSVTNNSDVPALETVVEMPAPAGGLRFVSNDQEIPREVDRYQVGRLDPGQTRTFGVTFEPSEKGMISTTATVTAYCADAVTKKIATQVSGVPAVQVSVVDRVDPVKVGENTVYDVRVINQGTEEDLNIQLTGELKGPLQFVEGTGPSQVSGQEGGVQFGPVERLAPGETAHWQVTAKGTEAGNGHLHIQFKTSAAPKGAVSSEPTTVF